MSATSSRYRARKRAECAERGHDRVVLVDGREWCEFCRWWVGTPIVVDVPVLEVTLRAARSMI